MATKKTIKEEIKEEAKNEVPVVKGGGDTPLPPIPSQEGLTEEYITVRGKCATYNIYVDLFNCHFKALIVDHDGYQYEVDADI